MSLVVSSPASFKNKIWFSRISLQFCVHWRPCHSTCKSWYRLLYFSFCSFSSSDKLLHLSELGTSFWQRLPHSSQASYRSASSTSSFTVAVSSSMLALLKSPSKSLTEEWAFSLPCLLSCRPWWHNDQCSTRCWVRGWSRLEFEVSLMNQAKI